MYRNHEYEHTQKYSSRQLTKKDQHEEDGNEGIALEPPIFQLKIQSLKGHNQNGTLGDRSSEEKNKGFQFNQPDLPPANNGGDNSSKDYPYTPTIVRSNISDNEIYVKKPFQLKKDKQKIGQENNIIQKKGNIKKDGKAAFDNLPKLSPKEEKKKKAAITTRMIEIGTRLGKLAKDYGDKNYYYERFKKQTDRHNPAFIEKWKNRLQKNISENNQLLSELFTLMLDGRGAKLAFHDFNIVFQKASNLRDYWKYKRLNKEPPAFKKRPGLMDRFFRKAYKVGKIGYEKGKKIYETIKILGPTAVSVLRKAGPAFIKIILNPGSFFRNLKKSLKIGFEDFKMKISSGELNIMEILGLDSFNPKTIVTDLLKSNGLTWKQIKANFEMGKEQTKEVASYFNQIMSKIKSFIITGDLGVFGADKYVQQIKTSISKNLGGIKQVLIKGVVGFIMTKLGISALKKLNPLDGLKMVLPAFDTIVSILNKFMNVIGKVLKGNIPGAASDVIGVIKMALGKGAKLLLKFFGIDREKINAFKKNLHDKTVGKFKKFGGNLFNSVKRKFSLKEKKANKSKKKRGEKVKNKSQTKPSSSWNYFKSKELLWRAKRKGFLLQLITLRTKINETLFKNLQTKWGLNFDELIGKINNWQDLFVLSRIFPSFRKRIAVSRMIFYRKMLALAKNKHGLTFKADVTGSSKGKKAPPIKNDLDVTISGKHQGQALSVMEQYAISRFGKNWEHKINSTLFTSHKIGNPKFYRKKAKRNKAVMTALKKNTFLVRRIIWSKLQEAYKTALGAEHGKNTYQSLKKSHWKGKMDKKQMDQFELKRTQKTITKGQKFKLAKKIDCYYQKFLNTTDEKKKAMYVTNILSIDRTINAGNPESYVSWGSRKYELDTRPQEEAKKKNSIFINPLNKLKAAFKHRLLRLTPGEAYDYAVENLAVALKNFKSSQLGNEEAMIKSVLNAAKYFERAIKSVTLFRPKFSRRKKIKERAKLFSRHALKIKGDKTVDSVKEVLIQLYPGKSLVDAAKMFLYEGMQLSTETLMQIKPYVKD